MTISITLMFLLLIPITWVLVVKVVLARTISNMEAILTLLITCSMVLFVWVAGIHNKTSDVEIFNGHITSKNRKHDTYLENYQCNCKTVTTNNTSTVVCSTCTRRHYTVDWYANSTVGNISFDSLDSLSSSVYDSKDPSAYTNCIIGEPASLEHSYTNYIKAVDFSVFKDEQVTVDNLDKYVPAYPRVYNFYRINRVIDVNNSVPRSFVTTLNTLLNDGLKTLGHKKQVNIIVIMTNIMEPRFRYNIERKWLGGKKNDVVVMIGTKDSTIQWVDVMTWAKNINNEKFRVVLRDDLQEISSLDEDTISRTILSEVQKSYVRPRMEDFKYVETLIEPDMWVIVMCVLLGIGMSLGLTWFFHFHDL